MYTHPSLRRARKIHALRPALFGSSNTRADIYILVHLHRAEKSRDICLIQYISRILTLIISIQLGWAEGFADLAAAPFFVDDVALDISEVVDKLWTQR